MNEPLLYQVLYYVPCNPIDGQPATWESNPLKQETARKQMRETIMKYIHTLKGKGEYGKDECFIWSNDGEKLYMSAVIRKVELKDLPHV